MGAGKRSVEEGKNIMASSSRLPRPHLSSSDHRPTQLPTFPMPASFSMALSTSVATRKRKAAASDDDTDAAQDQPRKLPAIAEHGDQRPVKPLRHNRAATNVPSSSSKLSNGPPPLTKPRAPTLSGARMARATSAPPKSGVGRPVTRSAAAAGLRGAAGRTTSGPVRPANVGDKRMESARAADNARLAADMEAERLRVSEIQANNAAIARELQTAKTQELSQRRELMNANDEIEALRKKHASEVRELEADMKKRDREIRDLGEDLRVTRGDLDREREVVGQLKTTVAQQSTAQLTLSSQNQALQAQLGALQASFNYSSETLSSLKYDLERSNKRIEELELEVREAEMVRRKLHNMVQELKGNIRVFCRVRPLLPSDISGAEDQERARQEAMADIAFPDTRDHKEIVLYSASENAMGQERKETWNFGFDRVMCSSLRLGSLALTSGTGVRAAQYAE